MDSAHLVEIDSAAEQTHMEIILPSGTFIALFYIKLKQTGLIVSFLWCGCMFYYMFSDRLSEI